MKIILGKKVILSLFFSAMLLLYSHSKAQVASKLMNRTMSDEFIVEPPTLVSAGFEWIIFGDENRNSRVSVSYRKLDDKDWKEALPLLRIGGEKKYGHGQRWIYTTPDMFAGSNFHL